MAKNFLLEIGLEEMPAHVVTPTIKQLTDKVAKFLAENRLTYDTIEVFSTPRRLAIKIVNLPEKQADTQEEVKGPAKKIALDAEGNWSKSAEGFVRGQGLTTDDITFKEIKGVEYVYVTKFESGRNVQEVLAGLATVILSLTFPVTMHWANYDLAYIRPIHWLVALLDDEIIPFEILDIKTSNTSRGHRFLGKTVTINHADEYQAKMAEQFVIVDAKERKDLIRQQIAEIAEANHWQVVLDEDLLEEVNNLVEYPTAFVGNFDEKYLSVPEEVLVTSMKEHQRYFEIRNSQGLLLPHFISVRNGDKVKIDNVIKGNEKVLIARLEDAEFFFEEDKKITIATCVEKLKSVTFHEKIGNIYEKMQRTSVIAALIGEQVGLSATELADLQRASEIYKFDLVTNMVGEFPELQGIMGEKYALLQGENPAVAQAIREHYQPISSEGELPESAIGAVLAIADKLDSVLTFFAVDMIPSGSNDPYALRRQAYGVIRIIEAKGWRFPLRGLQEQINEVINADEERFGIQLPAGQTEVIDFIKARIRQFLSTKSVRHDVIDAILAAEHDDLMRSFSSASILKEHLTDEDFRPSVEALTRVLNLAKKAEDTNFLEVDPKLFENGAENELFEAVAKAEADFATQTIAENYRTLRDLRPYIEKYFEETMVMAEDPAIRKNRLNQLYKIAKMTLALGSLDLLIVK
ncbi:glycyl-tRNA synthetase beta chain [Enterococcus sp. PF1-24]|uniref:glycine--tRNA ligase subunit beta n=1 Tax=unclassified Enterococcus TaxID=2608891 RepID=UPI0024752A11|nr:MULTISPECIES: glycine--tRNA ligase subunit beta [unclassified Enterococcus]MDH6365122.1 glycyl-tRNA synthetase beta chain [Enterococcus sp. PFB1-1]MDH6402223.1 glycyl-tRNA synthetase beta chain [Enterococcus sp. PF1-24]